MKRLNTFPEKLKNYSLLTGSILASSLIAKSQVIYTDVNPDKELGGSPPSSYPYPDSLLLDLNNDGQFDFKVALTIYGIDTQLAGYSFREKIDGVNLLYNKVFSYTIEYVPWAFKMNCDDSIPLGAAFIGTHEVNLAFQLSNAAGDNWNNVHDGYVGLQFMVDSDIHFGWLRLDVNTNDTVPNIIVKDFAYEATPNKKIAVCDTGLAVGISEISASPNATSVFPNPSNGHCVIRGDGTWKGEIQVSVKDISGKEVFSTNFQLNHQQKETSLDLSELPSGLYFIQLKSASNSAALKWTKL